MRNAYGEPTDRLDVPDDHEFEEPEQFRWDVWIVVSKGRYKTGLTVFAGEVSEAENKATVGVERLYNLFDPDPSTSIDYNVVVRKTVT